MILLSSQHPQNCTKCKLCETRKHIVPSILPENAQILLVGEAPGVDEDAQGTKPFVGAAGKLLNECFTVAGLDRASLGLGNVVRCLPKEIDPAKRRNTRQPNASEIRACSEFLDKEIDLLKPKLIICLGAVALKRFVKDAKIGEFRGRVFQHTRYGNILATYHPAKVLHEDIPSERTRIRELIIRDLIQAKTFVEGGAPARAKYDHKVVQNLDQVKWLYSQLNMVENFSFDIETSSYDYLRSQILSVSFSWKLNTAVTLPFFKQGLVPFWNEEDYKVVYRGLQEVFSDPTTNKIAHNGKFDIQHLYSFGIPVRNFYADTLLMHFCIEENSVHDLKSLSLMYTDLGGYEIEFDEVRKKIAAEKGVPYKELSFAELPEEVLWRYANMDADSTFRLFHIFWPKLEQESMVDLFFELYMPMSKLLGKIEFSGVTIDMDYLEKTIHKYERRIQEKEKRLLQEPSVLTYIEQKRERYRQKRREKWEKSKTLKKRHSIEEYQNEGIESIQFNFSSSKQLKELFIDLLKLKPVKVTEKNNASFDDEALELYAKKVPIARIFSGRNKLLHLYTTFLVGIKEKVRKDGKLHTSFNLHVARTGRLSSVQPNLQNVPNVVNNPEDAILIRNAFVADKGCSLVECDYAQLEFRVWGQLSQDEVLFEDLRNGVDIHTEIAAAAFNISKSEVTKQQRSIAKTVVFGSLYGRTPGSIAEQLGISVTEARKIQDILFKRYKKGAQWLTKAVIDARRYKYSLGVFGQKRRLAGMIDSRDLVKRGEAERLAKNSPIQGSASQMNCFADLKIEKMFKEQSIRGRTLMLIHDAIVLNVDDLHLSQAYKVIKEGMLNPHSKINVPLAIEVKVGKRWGEMKVVQV